MQEHMVCWADNMLKKLLKFIEFQKKKKLRQIKYLVVKDIQHQMVFSDLLWGKPYLKAQNIKILVIVTTRLVRTINKA